MEKSSSVLKGVIEYLQFIGAWWSLMSGVLSIPFAFIALFSEGHTRGLFALLAFAALLISAGGLVKRILELKEALSPKLEIKCGPDVPGCKVPNQWSGGSNLFYRVAVKTKAYATVQNCQGRLISIKKGPDFKWHGDSAVLTFAPGEKDDSEAKTVHPDVTVYLDVLMLLYGPAHNLLGIHPGTKDRMWRLAPSLEAVFNAHGDYVLTIQIVGDQMQTITRFFEFKWCGDQTSELRLL